VLLSQAFREVAEAREIANARFRPTKVCY